MTMRILKDQENNTFSPCIMCDKVLKGVSSDSILKSRQPYAGGEIQLIFGYGSTKFDDNIGVTKFAALICDDCAEKLVPKMDRLTVNMRERTSQTLINLKAVMSTDPIERVQVTEDLNDQVSQNLDNCSSRNNEW